MRKPIIILASLMLTINAMGQQDTLHFTLPECVKYAFSNSYERQSMVLDIKQQEENVRGAKLEQAPSVSASLGEDFQHSGVNKDTEQSGFSGNADIRMSMDLMNFSIYRNVKAQKITLESTKLKNDQYDQNLVISILREYIQAIGFRELAGYQTNVLEASRQQMLEGEKKYKAGSILESDYLILKAQYATNVANLAESKASLDNAMIALKVLMSMDPTTPLALVAPSDEIIDRFKAMPSMDYALEQAKENMPDMKLSENALELAKQELKVAKTGYIPTIGLNASIGTGHNGFDNFGTQLGNNFSQGVGVSVSVPIYDRSQTETQVRRAKISIQQSELEKKQTEQDIVNTVVQNYTNIKSAISTFDATKEKYEAWLKTVEVYRTKFRLGSITAVNLLQQENNFLSALNDYIQAKYTFVLQRQLLNIYMGQNNEGNYSTNNPIN